MKFVRALSEHEWIKIYAGGNLNMTGHIKDLKNRLPRER